MNAVERVEHYTLLPIEKYHGKYCTVIVCEFVFGGFVFSVVIVNWAPGIVFCIKLV